MSLANTEGQTAAHLMAKSKISILEKFKIQNNANSARALRNLLGGNFGNSRGELVVEFYLARSRR